MEPVSLWALFKVFAVAAGGAAVGTVLIMALIVGAIIFSDLGEKDTEL